MNRSLLSMSVRRQPPQRPPGRRAAAIAVSMLFLSWLLVGCAPGEEPVIDRPAEPPTRVILVTLDTLRADHLGSYGYPRDVSRFLDSVAARGARFSNAYAASSTTLTSHASLFTSLYPPQHQLIRNGETLHDQLFTMAEMFAQQGYQTAAFSTVNFMSELAKGFEVFSTEKRYYPADRVLGKAEAWLSERSDERPLFLFLHLFDVHEWYRLKHLDPETRGAAGAATTLSDDELVDYLTTAQGIDRDFLGGKARVLDVVNRYDDQIVSTDRRLERFYRWFEERGLNENALWIITSDHGEGIGSHRFRGHGGKIYNEQIRIPLFIHRPDGGIESRVVDRVTSHVDLLPTLAELVGGSLEQQVFPISGRSLLSLLYGGSDEESAPVAFAQRREADPERIKMGWEPGLVISLQNERYKYLHKSDLSDELYDLLEDATESSNLIDREEELAAEMRRQLLALHQRWSEQGELLGRSEIDPRHLEELRALGYLGP